MAMDVEEKEQLGFPYWKSVRRTFGPESPFFASGNVERELIAKQVALDLTEDEKNKLQNLVAKECGNAFFVMATSDWFWAFGSRLPGEGICYVVLFCPIVGCGSRLTSLENFEDHYNARHTASCSICSRVYPTSRLLSIHVSEAHDSFFQAKVARGYAMYECLVEGCSLKFKSYKSRQQHLVDKHKFTTSFEFFKKAHSSKKQRQKLQRKQGTHKWEEASCMEVENESIDGLVSAVSKLSTSDSSPSSVSFGRRHTRGLSFVPRAVQRDKKRPDGTEAGTK